MRVAHALHVRRLPPTLGRSVKRPLIALVPALLAFAGAAFQGWRAYVQNPHGALLYTPNGPCPTLMPTFSLAFTFWLCVAGVVAAVFAALTMAIGLGRDSLERFRGVARTALWVLPWLALLWCTYPMFEAVFPQQPVPGCEKDAP